MLLLAVARPSLTAEPADAELVAKMRRQNRWVIGLLSAAVVLVMFTMGVFSASLRPFFDQWSWLLHLLAALAVADFVIRILRRPRPVKPQ
jgi:hypothetical protein